LRIDDNTDLHLASRTGAEVLGLYVFSSEDFDARIVSPARIDFILRSLEALREDLRRLRIPLWIEVVEWGEMFPEGWWSWPPSGEQRGCMRIWSMRTTRQGEI
jgi:deoxyribodipyrimidine photolyase